MIAIAEPDLDNPRNDPLFTSMVRGEQFALRSKIWLGVAAVLFAVGGLVAVTVNCGAGAAVAFVGVFPFVLGCINLARLRGVSAWWGMLGYVPPVGLIALWLIRDRRESMQRSGELREVARISRCDAVSESRYWLLLVPLVVAQGSWNMGMAGWVNGGTGWVNAVLANAPLNSGKTPPGWLTVEPQYMPVRFAMPGPWKQSNNSLQTPAGELMIVDYITLLPDTMDLFNVECIMLPPSNGEMTPNQLINLGRKHLLKDPKSRIVRENQLWLAGQPGIELEIATPDGGVVVARVCGNLFTYILSAHITQDRDRSDVKAFFDSFRFVHPWEMSARRKR